MTQRLDRERVPSVLQNVVLIAVGVAAVLGTARIVEGNLQLLFFGRPLGGDLQHLVWGFECPAPAEIKGPADDRCLGAARSNPLLRAVVGLALAAYVLVAPRFGISRVRAVAVLAAVLVVVVYWPQVQTTYFPAPEPVGGESTWGDTYARLRWRAALSLGGIASAFLGGTLLARFLSSGDR